MMDGVLENVPSARISVVGMYRNEETLEPVPYFQKLVSNIDERMALIVDQCWQPVVPLSRPSTC